MSPCSPSSVASAALGLPQVVSNQPNPMATVYHSLETPLTKHGHAGRILRQRLPRVLRQHSDADWRVLGHLSS